MLLREWFSDSNNWLDPRVLWHMLARIAYEIHDIPRRIVGGKHLPFSTFLDDAGVGEKKDAKKEIKQTKWKRLSLEELKEAWKNMSPEEKAARNEASKASLMVHGFDQFVDKVKE